MSADLQNKLAVQNWPIDKVLPYARNARTIPQAAVDKVAASIKEFSFRQPIVVDKLGVVVVGHVRLLAAKKLGLAEVPVHVVEDLSPAQIKTYRVMDNRSHQESDWDLELLAPEISELQALCVDLSLTGFDMGELKNLLEEDPKAGLTDEDAAPEVKEDPATVRGDVWVLGEHRLLCGDAVQESDVARLMGPEQADLVFTDPPYNVAYQGYTEEKLIIQNDAMTAEQFRQFLKDVFVSFRRATKTGASLYVCHPSLYQREFQEALELAGFSVRCQIIWAKNTFAWGFGRYKFQHEPIFYCHVKSESDAWYGDKSQSTLWQEKKPSANRLHPTMKPVELIERALLNSSKKDDLILDLFGGAGSTLIAAERMDRKARLMELDPRYCDVIVNRWQGFTGRTTTLDGDGRTFAQICAERRDGR